MKTVKLILAISLTAILGFAVVRADDDDSSSSKPAALPPDSTKTGVTFDADIKPIFQASCVKCHDSKSAKKPKAGLTLDTREGVMKGSRDGAVVTAGDSAHSDLVMAVAHKGDDPDTFMPKGKNAKMLTPDQIGLIRAWIDQGAK
ncbi:MAG TPA: c-type cytochrome domain-containing protein [Verrucomicrobiae bacterium]|nr:c-type cytochrome domain-containing protein [Verrucomicrobiae bacterium]